jgi:hypothetical protein
VVGVVGEELLHATVEREGANAQMVEGKPLAIEPLQCLAHRKVAAAHADYAEACPAGAQDHGLGNRRARPAELPPQAFHVLHVVLRLLGVLAVAVVARAAREVRAPRMASRPSTVADAVSIHVHVAAKLRGAFQIGGAEHLAPVGPV